MAFNIGNITAFLTLDTSKFTKGLQAAGKAAALSSKAMMKGFKGINEETEKLQQGVRNTGKSFKDLGRIVGGIVVAQAFYGALRAIQATTAEVIRFSVEMEVANASLTRMLGTAEDATGYIEVLKDFAAVTEFSTGETIEFARRLTAMGFEAESTADLMRIVTDEVALLGGGSEKLNRIVYALGQIRNEAKLSAPNVRQLTEATVPVVGYLKKAFGLTDTEAQFIGKQGISGQDAVKAILLGMQEDSKGAAAVIAETVKGMMATIKDDILLVSEELLAPLYKISASIIRIIKNTLEITRKTLRSGGIGALINSIFSESMQSAVRAIIGSLRYLAITFVYAAKIVKLVFGDAIKGIIKLFGFFLPPILAVTATLGKLIYLTISYIAPLRHLTQALAALLVVNLVSTSIMFLYKVLRGGAIVLFFAQAIKKLALAFAALEIVLAASVVARVITYITIAIISLAAWLGWLNTLIAWATSGLSKLFGIDTSKIFQPMSKEEIEELMERYKKPFEALSDKINGVGDDAEEAGKKVKDTFLASFDEVFAIPDKLDKASDSLKAIFDPTAFNVDAFDDLKDLFPEIDLKINFPEPPPWLSTLLLGATPFIIWAWLKWKKSRPPKTPDDTDDPKPPTGKKKKAKKKTSEEIEAEEFAEELTDSAKARAAAEKKTKEFGEKVKTRAQDIADRIKASQAAKAGTGKAAEPVIKAPGELLGEISKAGKKLPKRDPLTGRFTKFAENVFAIIKDAFKPVEVPVSVTAVDGLTNAIKSINTIPKTVTSSVSVEMPSASVISDNFRGVVNDPISAATMDATDGVKGNFNSVTSWLSDSWKPALKIAAAAVLTALAVMFAPAGSVAAGTAGAVTVAVAAFTAAIALSFAILWRKIQPTKEDGDALGDAVDKNVLKPTENRFDTWRKGLAITFTQGMIDVIDIYNKYAKNMDDAKITIKPPVPSGNKDVLSNLFEFAPIRKFAKGGIVTRETFASIGEGNKKEAVIPLESSGVIRSFAKNIAAEMGGADNVQPAEVNYIMIGTLIGDERSITMLERKLNAVRIKEDNRKGLI